MADVVIPNLGESISEAVIGKWLKNVGEPIAADEPVVDLETDKVSVAVPAPTAGVLSEQRFAAGDTVRVGEIIGRITPGAAAAVTAKPSNGEGAKAAGGEKAAAATLAQPAALGQPTATPVAEGPKVIPGPVEQMTPAPRSAATSPAATAGHGAHDEATPSIPHSKTLPPSVRKAIREGAPAETAARVPAANTNVPAPRSARGP